MAFPRLWNPSMGGLVQDQPSRLRLPMPGAKSPYTGVGQGLRPYPSGQGIGPQIPQPRPTPSIPESGTPGFIPEKPYQPPVPQQAQPKLEVSSFMATMYKSIQNIDPEQRGEYLSTTAASIKDRMDRYEFRIARGVPLSPEQQRQYDSIKAAYNDIQKYINNPKPYDELMGGYEANIASARQPMSMSQQAAQGRMYQGA